MHDSKNQIIIKGMKSRSLLVGAAAKLLEQWIHREQSLLFLPQESNYTTQIEWDDEARIFHCNVWVKIGTHEWHCYEGHSRLREAIRHAIENLSKLEATTYLPWKKEHVYYQPPVGFFPGSY